MTINVVIHTHVGPPPVHLSILHSDAVCTLWLLLISSFSAGELEKQQGAKTHSVKNNGTQLELRGKLGSPSGVCEHFLPLKATLPVLSMSCS